MSLKPASSTPLPELADNDRLMDAERQCNDCIRKMEALVVPQAHARQRLKLEDKMLEHIEAALVAGYIRDGKAIGASEWLAVADAGYKKALDESAEKSAAWQETVSLYEFEKLKFENAMALRNDERARLKLL
jgi:hypothetical protein